MHVALFAPLPYPFMLILHGGAKVKDGSTGVRRIPDPAVVIPGPGRPLESLRRALL